MIVAASVVLFLLFLLSIELHAATVLLSIVEICLHSSIDVVTAVLAFVIIFFIACGELIIGRLLVIVVSPV